MRDDRERLLDILEAIERIEKYTARGRSVFDEDELHRDEKYPCSQLFPYRY